MVKDEIMEEFMDALASKAPVPGGGGAAALSGALAAALGRMVANLTIGKKKYADVGDKMKETESALAELQRKMLLLADRDEEVFEALSEAYRLPRNTDEEKAEQERILEERLTAATQVPLEVMENTGKITDLLDQIADCGSRNALSDAGVASAFARTALTGSVLTVTINTNSMKNREKAEEFNRKAEKLSEEFSSQADAVYERVKRKLSNIKE